MPPSYDSSSVARELAAIAVLPFANMSADKDDQYFSDGLSEEIINALTKVPGLRVIARTSSFRFRAEQDLRKIGESLQVGMVLEGSVRKSGNRLRITAQLINDSHICSERYDRDITDVFAIQDEISAAVVDNLKISFCRQLAVKSPLRELAANEAVLVGGYHWYKFTPAKSAKACMLRELNQSDVDTWMAAISFYPAEKFAVFDDRYFVSYQRPYGNSILLKKRERKPE
jgi:TolB-like protein